ncbi:hypothetical protein O3Q51_08315 [Cryomorphaceae bacterium 1068]|nr:hypothetical protein [Cryomorphaceae bacterium 1068]
MKSKNKKYLGLAMALGVAIGGIVSFVTEGGAWIAIGLALGAVIGARMDARERTGENNPSN